MMLVKQSHLFLLFNTKRLLKFYFKCMEITVLYMKHFMVNRKDNLQIYYTTVHLPKISTAQTIAKMAMATVLPLQDH